LEFLDFQGVPSWKWYFPYHYAPFASDFLDISSVITIFKKGTKPVSSIVQISFLFITVLIFENYYSSVLWNNLWAFFLRPVGLMFLSLGEN
jgi:hypothetical protein